MMTVLRMKRFEQLRCQCPRPAGIGPDPRLESGHRIKLGPACRQVPALQGRHPEPDRLAADRKAKPRPAIAIHQISSIGHDVLLPHAATPRRIPGSGETAYGGPDV